MGNPGHFVAGVRYETTTISSAALVPAPVTTDWVGENEFNIVLSGDSEFTRFKGHYQNWLPARSEEHTSELQSLMRISYAVFCLKTKTINKNLHSTSNLTERNNAC